MYTNNWDVVETAIEIDGEGHISLSAMSYTNECEYPINV